MKSWTIEENATMLTGTYTSELSQYLIGKIKNLKDYKKRIKRINLFVAILRKLKKYYLQNYCFDSNLIRKRIN